MKTYAILFSFWLLISCNNTQRPQPSEVNVAAQTDMVSSKRNISKKETEDWILNKFKSFSYPLYEDRKADNAHFSYTDYQFAFKNDNFIISYSVEQDYRKSKYIEQVNIPIKDVTSIFYGGSLNPRLMISGEKGFVVRNLSNNAQRFCEFVEIGFWTRDKESNIDERLSKAFWYLQNDNANTEPF